MKHETNILTGADLKLKSWNKNYVQKILFIRFFRGRRGKTVKKFTSKIIAAFLIVLITGISFAASADTTVYVTRTGDKYHVSSCSYLRKSKIPIALGKAVSGGYGPCKRCGPPVLDK
jgi:hypothetical protein